jgi:hypothetical protein
MVRVEVHWLALTLGLLLVFATCVVVTWQLVVLLLNRHYVPVTTCAVCSVPLLQSAMPAVFVMSGGPALAVLCGHCAHRLWPAGSPVAGLDDAVYEDEP